MDRFAVRQHKQSDSAVSTWRTRDGADFILAKVAVETRKRFSGRKLGSEGSGQVVNMELGEKLSYKFTLDEAYRKNNTKATRELESIGESPYKDLRAAGIQRKWLAKFNGETYKGTSPGTIYKNMSIRDLGPLDLFKFIKGAIFSLQSLEEQQNKVNLFIDVPEINVPVFFCSGCRDYNVPFELVVEYIDKLRALSKEIIWFEKSAHLPNFEEPDVFRDFCVSRLKNLVNTEN